MATKATTTTAAPARVATSKLQVAADPQATVASNNSLLSDPKARANTKVEAKVATTTETKTSTHLNPSLSSPTEQATVERQLSSNGKHLLLALRPKLALALANNRILSQARHGSKKNPKSFLHLKYQGSQVQR